MHRRWLCWIPTLCLAAAAASAQTPPAPVAAPSPAESSSAEAKAAADAKAATEYTIAGGHKWLDCDKMWSFFASQCSGLGNAWYDGKPTLYFSGYSWHDPNTYDETKQGQFNDRAWGGGFGWAKDAPNGDNFSWYALIFRDSHYQYTKMAGWGWMTYWPAKAPVAVGLGGTVFLMSRPDIYNSIPFPAILPLASVKAYGFEVLGTFVPKVNGGVNHGNVAYFFARYQF
jgi:palmitoyl transferase